MYDWVDDQLNLDIVGILPVYQREGYLFIHAEGSFDYQVYRYKLSRIQRMGEAFRALKFNHLQSGVLKPFETFNQLKAKLTKQFKDLPTPAVWLASAKFQLPFHETLLPMAKRKLMLQVKI